MEQYNFKTIEKKWQNRWEAEGAFHALNDYGCVFQYTRSGRIAVTRSKQEEVSTYLEEREKGRLAGVEA